MMADVTLAELTSSATSTREEAWRRLYEAHADMVFRLSLKLGTSPSDAEDVVQKVFVTAHERLSRLDHDRALGGWLRGITVRVVSDWRRWRRVRQVKHWLVRSTQEDDREQVCSPEDAVTERRAQARVAEVMGQLSPKLAPVLALTDLEGGSVEEAAEILGIPVNTVRSRRRIARERFRELWEAHHG